jgi:tetratricopeptide (TPR) repeat protein
MVEFLAWIAAEQTQRLAEAEVKAGRAAIAETSVRSAILERTAAGHHETAMRLAESWQPLEKAAKAEREYHIAFSLQMLSRDAGEALKHYDTALQLGFDEFWVLYHRGQLLFKLGDRVRALADLDRAVQLRPEHVDAVTLLAKFSGA